MPNAFITPVWIYREGLIRFFATIPGSQDFVQRIRTVNDAEVEALNTRVCAALARIDGWDEDDA